MPSSDLEEKVVMAIHELIAARRSSRVMDPDRPVDPALIERVLEAARWAPSSGNGQPWRFLVFDDRVPEALDEGRRCLTPMNQAWANRAPVLILAVAKEVRDNGKFNPKAQHDLGLANENLLLQAIALGLHCRPMGGFDQDRARRSFGIPEGSLPMVMIALGYQGQIEELPSEVQEKEALARRRRPIARSAFLGRWGSELPVGG